MTACALVVMTQPLLPCLLPSAKTYNTLRTTTNPYEATIAVKAAAAEAAGDAADKRKSRWAPDGKLLVMGTSGLFFSPLVPSFAARTCVGTAIDEDRPGRPEWPPLSPAPGAFTGALTPLPSPQDKMSRTSSSILRSTARWIFWSGYLSGGTWLQLLLVSLLPPLPPPSLSMHAAIGEEKRAAQPLASPSPLTV